RDLPSFPTRRSSDLAALLVSLGLAIGCQPSQPVSKKKSSTTTTAPAGGKKEQPPAGEKSLDPAEDETPPDAPAPEQAATPSSDTDRKSTRLNSSHVK